MLATRTLRFAPCILVLATSCKSDEPTIVTPINCGMSGVAFDVTSAVAATSCTETNGQLTVSGRGGKPPYQYSVIGSFQSSPTFTMLASGVYTVTIKDANGCTFSLEVSVSAANSTLGATVGTPGQDFSCLGPHTGSISITPTGGTAPYELRLGNGAFGTATSFDNLEAGSQSVTVRDADGCTLLVSFTVPRGDTGTSFSTDVQPIIAGNCALPACHTAGNGIPNFTIVANVRSSAAAIKLRTGSRSMPPAGQTPLTEEEIQIIACWVDDGAKNN